MIGSGPPARFFPHGNSRRGGSMDCAVPVAGEQPMRALQISNIRLEGWEVDYSGHRRPVGSNASLSGSSSAHPTVRRRKNWATLSISVSSSGTARTLGNHSSRSSNRGPRSARSMNRVSPSAATRPGNIAPSSSPESFVRMKTKASDLPTRSAFSVPVSPYQHAAYLEPVFSAIRCSRWL
jgi:hypothetical protein